MRAPRKVVVASMMYGPYGSFTGLADRLKELDARIADMVERARRLYAGRGPDIRFSCAVRPLRCIAGNGYSGRLTLMSEIVFLRQWWGRVLSVRSRRVAISSVIPVLACLLLGVSCAEDDSSSGGTGGGGGGTTSGPIDGTWLLTKATCSGKDAMASFGGTKTVMTLADANGSTVYIFASPSTCNKTISYTLTYSSGKMNAKGMNDGKITCSGTCTDSECKESPEKPDVQTAIFSYSKSSSTLAMNKIGESGDPICQVGEEIYMEFTKQ